MVLHKDKINENKQEHEKITVCHFRYPHLIKGVNTSTHDLTPSVLKIDMTPFLLLKRKVVSGCTSTNGTRHCK